MEKEEKLPTEKEKKDAYRRGVGHVATALLTVIVAVGLIALFMYRASNTSENNAIKQAILQNVRLKARVPERMIEKIVNPDGITGEYDVRFNFGDVCILQVGALLKSIANDNGQMLVKYLPPPNPDLGACPDGALFFISEDKFSDMNPQYKEMRDREETEKDRVRKLLAQSQ